MYCEIVTKGAGVPIVFLHGFLGSSKDWRYVISHIKNRTCIVYDLPGHGHTPWTSMEINDLLSSALPPQNIDLVGYSLGGRLAMEFSIQHPHRIHSLTLISSHYGLTSEEEKQARLQNDRIWAQKILALPFDEFLYTWYKQPTFISVHNKEALLKELFTMRKNQRPKELVSAMLQWSLGRQDYLKEQLLKFPKPIQFIYGKNDQKFVELYRDMPHAIGIDSAGHTLHFEAPEKIASLLTTKPL